MKKPQKRKSKLHPRNKHRGHYDFEQLTRSCSALQPFVRLNPHGVQSIDFANPTAVKMLNTALLQQFYGVKWDIPPHYLCPPVPGRGDYIHYVADVLATTNNGQIPKGKQVKCLDIGVGANCIYPVIGHCEYGWSFIGTDIDPIALASAKQIIDWNPSLKEVIDLRLQKDAANILQGILKPKEKIDLIICNPPFHASLAEAQAGTRRKWNNLNRHQKKKNTLNFGGQNNELWCKGGELQFVRQLIKESQSFAHSCRWFSSLVSKAAHLNKIAQALENVGAKTVKTIPMGQGNKSSRIVIWTFFPEEIKKVKKMIEKK